MNDNTTPREGIARSMTSEFSRRVWDGNFNPSPEPEYNKAVRDHVRSEYLNDADLVIAHLWREAMKPEVIAAMSKALWVADDKPGVGHGSDGYHMEAEHHIRLVLNLILGPRPNGEEAEHG